MAYAMMGRVGGQRVDFHMFMPVILFLVGMAIASVLLTRSIVQPLHHLEQVAADFGNGQFDARMLVQRRDAFGELAQAFNGMADRIVRLLRAQRELLASVSHELRTPLARIRVALDIAALDATDAEDASLGEIAQDLAELERLVSDIITASKLETQTAGTDPALPPMKRQDVDAKELLDVAFERFSRSYPQHHIESHVDENLPLLHADAVLLHRAVDNVLDNAGKYSPSQSLVTVTVRAADGVLRIYVQDQGIGIDADELEKVFEPFFRSEHSRARSTGGVGLGLTLARRIVVAHNGLMTLTSQKGKGTQVCIELPCQ